MSAPPEPHPLDYDWRFTAETVTSICDLLPQKGRVLAVGAPSVARRLESLGREVTLLDRHPLQGAGEHCTIELSDGTIEPGTEELNQQRYSAAIVDPPWYSLDFRRWTAAAAQLIGVDGQIIVSLWPDGTRPGDAEEVESIFRWIASWATAKVLSLVPHYERPAFEVAAMRASDNGFLASSPGAGRLVDIQVGENPKIPAKDNCGKRWLRFVLEDYQLALRLGEKECASFSIRQHPSAKGWIWPYVSKRAPGREAIDLWSSHNEVAVIGDASKLAALLRGAFKASEKSSFEAMLAVCPELLEWDIPRPPYRRQFEWHHLQ